MRGWNWMASVLGVISLFVCAILAKPPNREDLVAKSFRDAVDHQTLQSILVSIEERLRNLDNIYTMQLSPTIQDRLDQYHRKLEAIDSKIIRLESLMMLNLDKISENISIKNFKDDMARTSLVKKVDFVYEGISHRLSYLDRKVETTSSKIQAKLDAGLTRLEQMDEGFTRREEDIETELSDAIAAIDDLKTGCSATEENIVNKTQDYYESSLKNQKIILENHVKSNMLFQALLANTTRGFGELGDKVRSGIEEINGTNRFLEDMRSDLKSELNEYAVKVAEMNAENWNTGKSLNEKHQMLERVLNLTKNELVNGIRAVMLVVGKIPSKELVSDEGFNQIEKLNDKLDSNFEKVFNAQNMFMDSCYRLQMDESQIESKISDILEKLMETFEKKTAIELKDIRNLEKLIRSHDSHISRNLHQTGTNIVTVYEKLTRDNQQFETDLKRVIDHLSILSALVRNAVTDQGSTSRNVDILLDELKKIQDNMIALDKQGRNITSAAKEIREMAAGLEITDINDHLKNISATLSAMEAQVNAAYQLSQHLRNMANSTTPAGSQIQLSANASHQTAANEPNNGNNKTHNDTLDDLIAEVFGSVGPEETPPTKFTGGVPDDEQIITPCMPNYLDLIDVRLGGGGNATTINCSLTAQDSNKSGAESPKGDDLDELLGTIFANNFDEGPDDHQDQKVVFIEDNDDMGTSIEFGDSSETTTSYDELIFPDLIRK